MPGNDNVRVTWHTTPPTPTQLAAWRELWQRLLGARSNILSGDTPGGVDQMPKEDMPFERESRGQNPEANKEAPHDLSN